MQNALINHCEAMRYRFAVLDAHRPPQDSLADVQNQRQQFDTKTAFNELILAAQVWY